VVALITALLVAVSGHPVAWSVIGFLFAALPLTGLLLVVGVGLRGAVAAGPGWVGVRIFRHWRVVDLGEVRAVRLGFDNPFGDFGPFRSVPFGARLGTLGLPPGSDPGHDSASSPGEGPAGPTGHALVLEDASGGRIELEPDALESGLADVVRRGLSPNAAITPDAARALGAVPQVPPSPVESSKEPKTETGD
jgi:hypothetical protein